MDKNIVVFECGKEAVKESQILKVDTSRTVKAILPLDMG